MTSPIETSTSTWAGKKLVSILGLPAAELRDRHGKPDCSSIAPLGLR